MEGNRIYNPSTNGLVKVIIWVTVDSYKEGKSPYLIINCMPEFLSNVLGFIRGTFTEDYVCVIINDA